MFIGSYTLSITSLLLYVSLIVGAEPLNEIVVFGASYCVSFP